MDKAKIIESYSNTVWKDRNLDIVDDFFSETANIHSPLKTLCGPQAMREIIDVWFTAFPDLEVKHEDFITQGNRVVSQWSATGTHLGSFQGIEPTGKKISYTGVSIYHLSNEKVTDYWAYVNLHQLMDDLKPAE